MSREEDEVLVVQYEKLWEASLHYDQKLWLIPSAAYTLLIASYHGIFAAEVAVWLKPYLALAALASAVGACPISDETLMRNGALPSGPIAA